MNFIDNKPWDAWGLLDMKTSRSFYFIIANEMRQKYITYTIKESEF